MPIHFVVHNNSFIAYIMLHSKVRKCKCRGYIFQGYFFQGYFSRYIFSGNIFSGIRNIYVALILVVIYLHFFCRTTELLFLNIQIYVPNIVHFLHSQFVIGLLNR